MEPMLLGHLSMLLCLATLPQSSHAQIDTESSEVLGSGGGAGVPDFSNTPQLDIEADGVPASKTRLIRIAKLESQKTNIRCTFSNYEGLTIRPENTRLVRVGRVLPDRPRRVSQSYANFTFDYPRSGMSGKYQCLYTGSMAGQELRSADIELNWCIINQFICDNRCHRKTVLCNGTRECADGTDEHPSRCLSVNVKVDGSSALSHTKAEGMKSEFVCNFSNYEGLKIRAKDVKLVMEGRVLPETSVKEGPGVFKLTLENPNPSMSGKYHCLYSGNATLQNVKSTDIRLSWCGSNEFACDNRCRDKRVVCNGTRECSDGSDEHSSRCLLVGIMVEGSSALSIAKIEGLKSKFVCNFSNHQDLDITAKDVKLFVGTREQQKIPVKAGAAAFEFIIEHPKSSMSGNYYCMYSGIGTLQSVRSNEVALRWCGAGHFMCDNHCWDKSVICNGTYECTDGSDEQKSLCCVPGLSLARVAAAITGFACLFALIIASVSFQIGAMYGNES